MFGSNCMSPCFVREYIANPFNSRLQPGKGFKHDSSRILTDQGGSLHDDSFLARKGIETETDMW